MAAGRDLPPDPLSLIRIGMQIAVLDRSGGIRADDLEEHQAAARHGHGEGKLRRLGDHGGGVRHMGGQGQGDALRVLCAGLQITQTLAFAADDDVDRILHGVVGLDGVGVVIVGQEGVTAFACHIDPLAHADVLGNALPDLPGQFVEIGKIFGHIEDEQAALAVAVLGHQGEGMLPGDEAHIGAGGVGLVGEDLEEQLLMTLAEGVLPVVVVGDHVFVAEHMTVGQAHGGEILHAVIVVLAEETGGDHRVAAPAQVGFQLVHGGGVAGSAFGKEHHGSGFVKVGGRFHGDAAHAQIVVELILAVAVKGFPGRHANGVAQLAQHLIHADQLVAQSGQQGGVLHHGEVEEHQFFGLGQHGHIRLLEIEIHVGSGAEGVDPAAAIASGGGVFHQADDGIGQVPLQVLGRVLRIAGLGAGVDHIEDILLLAGVVAAFLIAFVPVGVFDDEIHLGVDTLGFVHDHMGKVLHHMEPVVLPAVLALGLDAHLTGAAGEEEVVQNDLVKHGGDIPHDLHVALPVGGIGVAEGVVVGGLALTVDQHGGGDAAGSFDAVAFKQFLYLTQTLHGNIHQTPVVFDIDLVQMHIVLVVVDGFLNVRVGGGVDVVGIDVCRQLEMLVGFHDTASLGVVDCWQHGITKTLEIQAGAEGRRKVMTVIF